MVEAMLDRPGAHTPLGQILTLGRTLPEDRLGLALALAGGIYERKIPREDVANFLRGTPTPGSATWNVGGNEAKRDELGLVLDLVTKMHNGTLPKDEVERYLRGEPTNGSRYWLVDKPTRTIETQFYPNFDVISRFSRGERGAHLRVFEVNDGFKTLMPRTIESVPATSVAMRPVRSETTAAKVFAAIGRDAALVSVPAFYDVLAAKQRSWWNRSSIIAFVLSESGEVAMLYANWLLMFGFGAGPDRVSATLLPEWKERDLNMIVGIEVIVPDGK